MRVGASFGEYGKERGGGGRRGRERRRRRRRPTDRERETETERVIKRKNEFDAQRRSIDMEQRNVTARKRSIQSYIYTCT